LNYIKRLLFVHVERTTDCSCRGSYAGLQRDYDLVGDMRLEKYGKIWDSPCWIIFIYYSGWVFMSPSPVIKAEYEGESCRCNSRTYLLSVQPIQAAWLMETYCAGRGWDSTFEKDSVCESVVEIWLEVLTAVTDDGCLLGCSAVQAGMSLPTFQRSVPPPLSGRWVLTRYDLRFSRRWRPWWWRQYGPLKRW
jgi:hypothetical protein